MASFRFHFMLFVHDYDAQIDFAQSINWTDYLVI